MITTDNVLLSFVYKILVFRKQHCWPRWDRSFLCKT